MKKRLLFRAPVLTLSGYGQNSRQLLLALIKSNKFEISIFPMNWGNTPFIMERDGFYEEVRKMIIKYETERRSDNPVQFDISVQVTIPNEFQRCTNHFPCNDEEKKKYPIPCSQAKVNIGVTAGIEVDRVSPQWIEKINQHIDLLVVPSKHSANGFSVCYQTNNGPDLKLEKPAMLVPHGIDTTIFNNSEVKPDFDFSTDFNFLCVGLGMDKGLGEDRKNISTLIKWFCERFAGDRNVGLVLKTSIVNNTELDLQMCQNRIQEFKNLSNCGEYPKIHLVHGKLTDLQLAKLYKHPKIKSFITIAHGEGFGIPVLEAAACDLPIMATNWSGYLDFLNIDGKRRFMPLDFELKEIPQAAVWNGVMEVGTKWAYVKEEDVKLNLKKFQLNSETPKKWAAELGQHVRQNYCLEKIEETFVNNLLDFYEKFSPNKSITQDDHVKLAKQQLKVPEGMKTLLYTMPMSAGDVFISTAVVNSLKKKFPHHLIYFATLQQYVQILNNNTDIHQVVNWEQWMGNVPLLEQIFDEVYTPNLAIQLNTSNWVRGGKGRKLAEEMASQCNVELGKYKIVTDVVDGLPEKFVVLNPGSGKGQWEARSYLQWQEVINNIKNLFEIPVLQIGMLDDPTYENVVDFRGRTTYNQLAYVVSKADCVVGIDSVTSHLAAGFDIPQVSIYGSSYANSTGPVYNKSSKVKHKLLDTKNRYTCDKACYKYTCQVDKDNPCVNEISPMEIVKSVYHCLNEE